MVLIRLGLENGETIGAGDKRRIGVETLLKESGSDTLAAEFWDLHHKPLRLSESCRRMPHSRGSEGAPKGHRSETETETKTTTERSGGAEVEEPKPEPPQLVLVPTEPTEKPKRDPVDLVFEAWRYRWSPKAQLDEARRKRIKARLAEGYSAEVLIEAIHNAERDPYLLGGNDRGKRYTGLETLLRDASQVDRLVALEAEPDYTPDFDWDGKPPDVEDTGPGVPPPQEFLDAFADLKRKITINAR
jgi:hypothetical protein